MIQLALLAQLAAAAQPATPVLSFPEAGIDDRAAYQGYATRFYRDARRNTVQVYLDRRSGRVVHLWANADNESIGLTVRDAGGEPSALDWGSPTATVSDSAGMRTIQHRLVAPARHIHLGWFLLGSMRVERDFQYANRHKAPFRAPRANLPEHERLFAALARLDPAERRRHLALLGAPDIFTLRRRARPLITTRRTATTWVARLVQPSLDGRDTLALEIHADPRQLVAADAGDSLSLRARSGDSVAFTVRIATSATPLTPLAREEIFTPEFLRFLAAAHARADATGRGTAGSAPDSAVIRATWLERQVRGVELLSSREKLMAGLPTYGTYFGRDMLVSALMMRSIWRSEMSEFVVASVLRKLSPTGQVSHEEALGGQAEREAAVEYAALVAAYGRARGEGRREAADSMLALARATLADARRVRENYHMIDDEYQLVVLAARWLGDPSVPAERKRAFLLDAADSGEPRVRRLLRELALVARTTAAYAADPVVANLVSFAPRDGGWAATSWRDSNAGYAGGRYAMDINAIWVPHALEATGTILSALQALGMSADSLAATNPELAPGSPLGDYAREPGHLQRAAAAWRGAERHFVVRLGPAEIRERVAARLAAMPAHERAYWTARADTASGDSLAFLALALDAEGRPIGVANSDVATRLFLGEPGGADSSRAVTDGVLRDVRLFMRPYPVGLFVDRVGPVVANDAYASPDVWRTFERDPYHGPRVVWGREVNLFLLGAAQYARHPALRSHAAELQAAIARTIAAVEASGFQSELWSYEVRDGLVVPVRYGTSSDIQLWSTTDLAVQFALSRLRP